MNLSKFLFYLVLGPAWVGVMTLAHLSHLKLASDKSQDIAAQRPLLPVVATQRLALTYQSAAADLFYLRALNTFGDKRQHKHRYPLLGPLLERATVLDPKFLAPYLLAGQALAVLGHDPPRFIALLEKGVAQHPEHWQLGFLLGFNLYFWLHDDARAAHVLSRTAMIPGSSPQIGRLAAQLAASAHTPRIGLRLVDTLLKTQSENERRPELLRRRDLLLLEVLLEELEQQKQQFEAKHHRPLRELHELETEKWIERIPPDPLGGEFFIDPVSQRVATHHEEERMTIRQEARGQPTHSKAWGEP